VAWHGVASTVGFVLLGLLAWSLALRPAGEPAATHRSER
jgi:hypothetical protein